MSPNLLTLASGDICRSTEFLRDFEQLTKNELSTTQANAFTDAQSKRLLESIAVLSLSSEESHQKLAYKIAVYLMHQKKGEVGAIPFVAELALTRLGDLPVIQQMVDNNVEDYFSYFGPPANGEGNRRPFLDTSILFRFPEVLERKAFNQVRISESRKLTFTNFQSRIWKYLRDGKDVALSGPTSAGKSYAILSYVASLFSECESLCAVYIVPTKALVAEVQASIIEGLKELGTAPEKYIVFTGLSALNTEEIRGVPKKVLVLTQERLLDMIANERMDFKVDLLVVDEAQQVSNDSRGIVIEDAVQELVRRQPTMQKVIISPYVSNPERFAKIFGVDSAKLETTRTTKSPVAQNIFLVSFAKKQSESKYLPDVSVLLQELREADKPRELALNYDLPLEKLPKRFYQIKAWVAKNLAGANEPTLIYCDKPSDCRKVAAELTNTFQGNGELSPALKEAIGFLRYQVHADYYLPDFLRFKVGYHYGTMPHFVRSYVRELFDTQEIIFLACTSTLLEGVNLPAKNLVLRNPKKGRLPMDSLSIRNLMGRAGRLRRDYYGKIFCIDVEEWESGKDAFGDKPELIESSSETALTKNVLELLEFLQDSRHEASPRVKSMASSLLMKQLLHPNSEFLSRFKVRNDTIKQEHLDSIAALLKSVTGKLKLEKSVILRNRTIDPRFQDELYQDLKRNPLRRFLPPFPLLHFLSQDLYRKLEPVFEVVAHILLRETGNTYRRHAVIASKWIKELPYKNILDGQIQYEARKAGNMDENAMKKLVNKTIEELDEVIEDKLRYDYTRCLQCYCDVLAAVLKEEGRSERYCEQLPLYLESGASHEAILFLIGAGLSRNAAIEISQMFGWRVGLPRWTSVKDTIEWLRKNIAGVETKVHGAHFREVKRLLGLTSTAKPA